MGQRLADLVENKMTYGGKTRPGDRLVLEWRLIETEGVVGGLRVNCRASSKILLSWISAYGEVVVFIRVVGGPDMLGRDGLEGGKVRAHSDRLPESMDVSASRLKIWVRQQS